MNCREFHAHVLNLLRLDGAQIRAMVAHLDTCQACNAEAKRRGDAAMQAASPGLIAANAALAFALAVRAMTAPPASPPAAPAPPPSGPAKPKPDRKCLKCGKCMPRAVLLAALARLNLPPGTRLSEVCGFCKTIHFAEGEGLRLATNSEVVAFHFNQPRTAEFVENFRPGMTGADGSLVIEKRSRN